MKKTIKGTKGFKEFQKIIDMRNFTKEKIERLEARSRRLTRRLKQIEPTGWKEFLQVTMHHHTYFITIPSILLVDVSKKNQTILGELGGIVCK